MQMNLFDLTGKKAIVTGASGGLGRGMAEGFHWVEALGIMDRRPKGRLRKMEAKP